MGIFDIFKKKDTKKIIQDEIFGELEEKSDYCYYGKVKLKFFGTEYDVKICITTFNENIEKIQYETYNQFIKNFQQIEEEIVSNLLMYYNGGNDIYPYGEKNAYGPDNNEESKRWWPDISTKEEMIKNIHIDEIWSCC